jgi:hypothetical protein
MDGTMSDLRPIVSLRGAADPDDGTGVRFPPGLGLIPPRDFSTRRIKPRSATEWTG